MQLSVIGLIICVVLFATTRLMGGSILVALMASLAFGSTAIAVLTSLGGSSPLIYTVFCALLLLVMAMHRTLFQDLGQAYRMHPAFGLVTQLMAYAVVSSVFFPRLFAGQTSAFVPGTNGGVLEVALGPVSGNISQTGYFLLGGMTFMAVTLLMMRGAPVREVRNAFLAWAFLNAAMGVLDLAGKMAGAGDVLEPIRTANYALHTEVFHGGFWRIAGGQPEASAFAGVSLASLGFCYAYWRRTGSTFALVLGLVVLFLLLLSTSSTAYAGLAVASIPVAWSVVRACVQQRMSVADLFLMGAFAAAFLAVLTVVLVNPQFFDPFLALLDSVVFNKLGTQSGQERMYWNLRSLQSLLDTGGLGVGMGSSRASSWPIAVISQLGVVGAVLMALLVAAIAREPRSLRLADPETRAVVAAIRAAALCWLVSGTMTSGTPDPGVLFFVSLGVMVGVEVRYATPVFWTGRAAEGRRQLAQRA